MEIFVPIHFFAIGWLNRAELLTLNMCSLSWQSQDVAILEMCEFRQMMKAKWLGRRGGGKGDLQFRGIAGQGVDTVELTVDMKG